MAPSWTLAAAGATALVISAASTPLFRVLALRCGLVDRPNARSSHTGLVARGGGVPLLMATLLGLALFDLPSDGSVPRSVLLGTLLLAILGVSDDRFDLPPFMRLAFHVAAASGVVWATGGVRRLPLPPPLDLSMGPWGAGLAVVWIVAVINFYNFLDGIDGLAGIQAVVTGTGIALACWEPLAAAMGATLAGASAGFLLHNWSPARIFLGDVGSGVLGFSLASAPLLAPTALRPRALLFVAISLLLFLADATWTLSVRVRRGDRWYQAHREHLYQRLVAAGWSHGRVAAGVGTGSAILTSGALVAWRTESTPWAWSSLALGVSFFGYELLLARKTA